MKTNLSLGLHVPIVLTCLVLFGCGQSANKYAPPPPPDVTIGRPVKKTVTNYFEATGTTAAIESVEIRARVKGFLQSVNFKPRAKVKAEALLFVIDPKPFEARVAQAQAALDGAKAEFNLAQVELDKAEQLFKKAAVSEIKVIEHRAKRDLAKAKVEKAKADLEEAKLELSYTQVKSPISGRVGRNLVDVGNLVGAGETTLLTTVVNDDSIYAYFNVSERALLGLVRKYAGKGSEVPPEQQMEKDRTLAFLQLADEKGFPHEGHMDFVETRVDTGTGTLQVRAIFPNSDGLILPGMFVRVRVPTEIREAVLIPDVAVLADQGGRYVLVVGDKDLVEQRRVKVGALFGQMRVIDEGLSAKDRVIVKGVQRARPGSKVNPVAASKPPESKKQPASASKGKSESKPQEKPSSKK